MCMTRPASGSQEHGRRELRASDLERMLEAQIRAGDYEAGARLPTVRMLAQQYGVDKNTASRAYQGLERRGLIDLARGRGAFVRSGFVRNEFDWQQRLEQLIRGGMQQGRSRAQLQEAFLSQLDRFYGPVVPRVAFIECNSQDLETLGDELSTIVDLPMSYVLLDEALDQATELAAQYDLLVTTFQHLGQLRQALRAEMHKQVIGVHVMPSHESLLELARLHVAVFGLVCDAPGTVESLTHIIHTYNPTAAVIPALINDAAQLQAVVKRADAIVVTRSAQSHLLDLGLPQPIVTVVFTIDQQSIDFLRRRLQELHELRSNLAAG